MNCPFYSTIARSQDFGYVNLTIPFLYVRGDPDWPRHLLRSGNVFVSQAEFDALLARGLERGGNYTFPIGPMSDVPKGCYGAPAVESARFMALERATWRHLTGQRPLSSAEQEAAYYFDAHLSAAQFFLDDVAEHNGLIPRQLLPAHDLQPYNYRDRLAGEARVAARILEAREDYEERLAAEVEAALNGGTATPTAAAAIEHLQRAIKADPLAPAGVDNVNELATLNPARRAYILAKLAGEQESHDARVQAAADTWAGNVIDYWQDHGPRVEMFRDDNPDLSANALFVRVTPRWKPLPKVSKFVKWGGLLSFAASFIPGIGNIISQGIGLAHKQSVNRLMGQAARPTNSIFDPQYRPVTMRFNLPGDLAAGLLSEPELLPFNAERLAANGYFFDFTTEPPAPKSAPLTTAEVRAARDSSSGGAVGSVTKIAAAAGGAWLLWRLLFRA